MVVVVDLVASGLRDQTDIGASLTSDSALVLFDIDTGQRMPAWAELHAGLHGPQRRLITIQPAVALTEGHTHLVALRFLVDDDGNAIEKGLAFAERLAAPDSHTRALLDGFDAADVAVDDVVVGWTFTVSSAESISRRLRHMWQETRVDLGEGAPHSSSNRTSRLARRGSSRARSRCRSTWPAMGDRARCSTMTTTPTGSRPATGP